MSMLPTMNQIDLAEGRLPETAGECLVDADFLKNSDYKVGRSDSASFRKRMRRLSDTFERRDLIRLWGADSSPCYHLFLSEEAATDRDRLGQGLCCMCRQTALCHGGLYGNCMHRWKGAAGADGRLRKLMMQRIAGYVGAGVEKIKKSRQQARYDEIVDQANEELADADTGTCRMQRQKHRRQLTDAKQELDDGWKQLSDAKEQVKSGKAELQSGKQELLTQQATLNEKKTELENRLEDAGSFSEQQLDQKKKELAGGRKARQRNRSRHS